MREKTATLCSILIAVLASLFHRNVRIFSRTKVSRGSLEGLNLFIEKVVELVDESEKARKYPF